MGTVPRLLLTLPLYSALHSTTVSCAHRLPRTSFTPWVRRLQFSPVSQHLLTTFPGILVLPPLSQARWNLRDSTQGQLRAQSWPTLPQERRDPTSHTLLFIFILLSATCKPLQVPSTKDLQDYRRRGQWEDFRGGERVTVFLFSAFFFV